MNKSAKDKELIELGKKLQAFYDMGYVDRKQAFKFTFIKSLISGFGAVLGATILIALLLWLLTLFSQIPIVGHFTHDLKQTIQSNRSVK